MRALVLQHVACEPPAVFEDVMVERGWEILRVELDEGESLPAGGFDAIVAMGGPMSVVDEHEHPWLVAEKQLIRESVRAGLPFWGSCLGVQLLASALGAEVYPGAEPEVGILPVMLTPDGVADPVFGGLPKVFPTLQWHGDTFDLPAGTVLLASSPAYANQAFRVGERAYGVQFHVEVTRGLSLEWAAIPEYVEYADRVHGPGAIERLLREFDASCEQMQELASTIFTRFCELAERAAAPFEPAVRRVLARLEPGEVVTYGEVAAEAGFPGAARAVGGLLARGDDSLPWWRVVTSNGRLVPGYEQEHAERLRGEGVRTEDGKVVAADP